MAAKGRRASYIWARRAKLPQSLATAARPAEISGQVEAPVPNPPLPQQLLRLFCRPQPLYPERITKRRKPMIPPHPKWGTSAPSKTGYNFYHGELAMVKETGNCCVSQLPQLELPKPGYKKRKAGWPIQLYNMKNNPTEKRKICIKNIPKSKKKKKNIAKVHPRRRGTCGETRGVPLDAMNGRRIKGIVHND